MMKVKMDSEYDRKFEEMKKYIPFLEGMISRLENTNSAAANPRQAQLDKIRSLRDLLLDKNKRMKMENLLKCEQVLVNLYAKVEKKDPFKSISLDEKEASKSKADLETVRNKLKTVVKIQDGSETLPEIYRANDLELNYSGSKEPALFQRRPNKSPNETRSDTKTESPQKRYTRVLVSPEPTSREWPSSEPSDDRPLFSRRSPPPRPVSPPATKKEKKKSKSSKSRKTKNVNITLSVPQESLKTLGTENIWSRILNCQDSDVDIDTLRDIRSQILGELSRTGKNEDISNLILQSYKKRKSKKKNANSKKDIEEGEISDSESEAIESIYGSLSVVDKEKKSSTHVSTIEDKDNQQRKIQICLVISDKDNPTSTDKPSQQPPVIDLSEFEMFSENESDKSKDIIAIDSDSSPIKKAPNSEKNKAVKSKTKGDLSSKAKKQEAQTENITEYITLDDDNEEQNNQTIQVEDTAEPSQENNKTNCAISKKIPDTSVAKDSLQSPTKNNKELSSTKPKSVLPNKTDSEQKESKKQQQKKVEQPTKFIANFYKPIEEQQVLSPEVSNTVTNMVQEKENSSVNNEDKNQTSSTSSDTTTAATTGKSPVKEKASDNKADTASVLLDNKSENVNKTVPATSEDKLSKESESGDKKKEESQKIPLLDEPTLPPKAKPDMLSQIDILQALKNEILSENISLPGTEAGTPALHQPKLTKVVNAQEVIPKKRISIEKYKEKAGTSAPNPLFLKRRRRAYREECNKKQSLKLTEKECERFNFPKRLSLDDDDDDDNEDLLSDDDFFIEDKEESFVLDDIYKDITLKSPDNECLNESSTPPVIIPTDLVKNPVVHSYTDVDMRTPMPTVSKTPLLPTVTKTPLLPTPPPLVSPSGANSVRDINRIISMDPRVRRDTKLSAVNSPNPYGINNGAPNMTPSRAPSMTPSYMPSVPQLMTPNARTFEITPTHQTFELDEMSTQKHVYAPSFSMCDNREREPSVARDTPYWDMKKSEARSRQSRWEESNIPTGGPNWESREPRSLGQNDGSRTPRYDDSCAPNYDKYNDRVRNDYKHDRRESSSYSKADCPMTPAPSFGWSECPPTPSSVFGRQETPMTPSHSFGRSDCPTTPVHPFGRGDCPSTPSSGFGRNLDITSNSSYSRSECPSTPSHSFGRSECPQTPTHSFGRSDCPQISNNVFARSESTPYGGRDVSNNSNQIYSKDPRLNRRPTEYESSERGRRESSYKSDRSQYSASDTSRRFDRDRSVGRYDRGYVDRNSHCHNRERRDVSRGLSISGDEESERLYTRDRVSRYEGHFSKHKDESQSRRYQRESSVSRTSDTRQNIDRTRALSVGRNTDKELNKDNISFRSDSGRNFTINTSVKSTFQDFLPSGKSIQVFDYSFDARRQRAASVGRSVRESSVDRTFTIAPTKKSVSGYDKEKNDRFKRACSVGRETANTHLNFSEIKADFQTFSNKLTLKTIDDRNASFKNNTIQRVSNKKREVSKTPQEKSSMSKQQYSPRKNCRDPRMRKEQSVDIKSRYKIDRRNDCDRKKSGIIYSSDNIAKGTIMGSGFGVKNYKIPKIKRPEPKPEIKEVKVTIEKISTEKETVKSIQKSDKKKTPKENNDTKTKAKLSKESVGVVAETEKNKSNNRNESQSLIDNDDSEKRITRSNKKTETKLNALVDDTEDVSQKDVNKTKKPKKAVIYDSDSDSGQEKDKKNKCTMSSRLSFDTPDKLTKTNKTKRPVSETEKELQTSLDSSFDMDIFSENLTSAENINALIADLEDDLVATKVSNSAVNTDMEKIMESIDDSPVNCLEDVSEVIEKDLSDNNLSTEKQSYSDKIQQINENVASTNKENSVNSYKVETKQDKITKDLSVDISLAKVNDDIVSTTAIDPVAVNKTVNMETIVENVTSNEGQSIPDSTIPKNISHKSLPDSTNDIHCELSTDVTSTNDTSETSNKESNLQSATQKNTFNQIGNLLSILQDKSKIKELLSMLGEPSSENEKIKKKLEKLSEIVSDEENEIEKQNLSDLHKEKIVCETKKIDKNEIQENAEENNCKKGDDFSDGDYLKIDKTVLKLQHETPDLEQLAKSSVSIAEPVVTAADLSVTVTEPGMTATKQNVIVAKPVMIENNQNSSSITDETRNPDKRLEINNALLDSSKDGIQNSSEETNKMECENTSNSEENVTLEEKAPKKIKGKKLTNKTKMTTKKIVNKRTTRAVAKTTVKKKRGVGRELQKLQEDIKEMFMSDDILNATGIRMCRLAKMVNEKQSKDSVVVEEKKAKGTQNQDQQIKMRKKPGPKPKAKTMEKRSKSPEEERKSDKSKIVSKYKPGPKSKKSKNEDIDPYEFDTDSFADTSTTKESEDESSDSETGSLASSRIFGSSEMMADIKKKPKKKRRGIGGWQSGIIKPKNRKKKETKQENSKLEYPVVKPQRPVTIPDHNCFTDKSYCFQKDVTTYDCRLCVYSGSDIVSHYKNQHPHIEIPLSRMDEKTSEFAIMQCEQFNYQVLSKISSNKYKCRFCHKEFANNRDNLELFFWHVVSDHTGEFKHNCPECVNVSRCPLNLDIPPPSKVGQLIGYICKKCNFTQVSLENLKTHVIDHHSDEQTEVFKINLAVISNKAMKAMLRQAEEEKPRVLRSLRSNQSSSDIRDDRSDGSENSDQESDCERSETTLNDSDKLESENSEPKLKIDKMKAKLTFENDEPIDETTVKIEQDIDSDHDVASHFDDTFNTETAEASRDDTLRGNSDDVMDYAHFKLNYTDSGAKEYVCCINGNESHYKTSLLISMKKHIQTKHSEKWDGYCCLCKVIVTLQGVQSDFRDCLSHFLDKHMDDFPVLEKIMESAVAEPKSASQPETNISSAPSLAVNIPSSVAKALSPRTTALSPAIPARVATPSSERSVSPSYIAVRPMAELLSREHVIETSLEIETPIALPKIQNVVSLGEDTVPPAQASPVYPTNSMPDFRQDEPFLYEDVQAEVMSKKHRVVLDAMMSKENLVRVFKCAGRFCSFTTDSVDDALLHATAHQRVGGEGALNCAYCNYDACDNGIDLVMHVFKDHSRCQYCCPLCFYRAAAGQLVDVHYGKAHSGSAKLNYVLRSTVSPTSVGGSGLSTNLLTRDVAVQHYICNHDEGMCNFKTYTPGKFIEHLQLKHPNAASHPCNVCPTAPLTPAELVLHLRTHGLKLYQCTWCVHGANTEVELLAHVAARHPDRQPQAYVRVITTKGGTMRVLPLANLNKIKVSTEDITPNATKENPVKEAERSIDLEKLIGHTMMMIDSSTSENIEDAQTEEPVEIPVENLPDDHDVDDATALESLLTTVIPEKAPETSNTSEKANDPAAVKTEPAEIIKDLVTDIICLDSDDESDTVPQAASVSRSVNTILTSAVEEVIAKKVSTDISRKSVTDDVSITKIKEDDSKNVREDSNQTVTNQQVQTVIDLSDDEPTLSIDANTSSEKQIINKESMFKCPGCFQICKSTNVLKSHVNIHCKTPIFTNIKCPHNPCPTIVPSLAKLLSHFVNDHKEVKPQKPLIHYCGICNSSFTTKGGAKLHMRSTHKVTNFIVEKTADGNGSDKITIVPATSDPTRASSRKTSTEIQRYQAEPTGTKTRKPSTELKKRYGIDDIDKLPISPILDTQVYCELCDFGTKVKVNMVRHLLQHAEKVPVPRTAPVNPVPHLETNEMHFDKMVNLASSSAATRAADKPRQEEPAVTLKIPPSESSRYPKYVPERLRYTCGAKACSYISVDMAMFRCHWETLHAREDEYRCVHCPPNQALDTSIPLNAARILFHLRMHDVNLYACSLCSYYNYRKHLIEKHILDTHKDGTVRVVREEYQPEPVVQSPVAATTGAPTMDLKPWQCGLCQFSSMLRPEVVNHCGAEHQSKMQFKCAHCPFRTSTKENVVKHQTNAHPNKAIEEVFYFFYREGSIPEEPDGIPLWQKQRQKLRLDELKTEPEPVLAPQVSTPISITPVSTPTAVDLNIVKAEKPEETGPESELSKEELCKKYGEFCEPDGIKYKCCLCNVVTAPLKETMQCHLYEELNYRRWECDICSYKAFHKNGLNDHMAAEHTRQFNPPKALPTDVNIEKWVQGFLDHQAKAIEINLKNLSVQKIQVERVSVSSSPKKPESPKRPTLSASEAELQHAFGEFGAPKNQQYACPKCDFTTKDDTDMGTHLESELSKIRWGCSTCSGKYTTYHEAQFHCRSAHTPPAFPKEAIRDPSIRSGWVKAVVATQKQFIKCTTTTEPARELSPEKSTEDNENSLLVALYDEPVNIDERNETPVHVPPKRSAPVRDSDDDSLVIDEPPAKKVNDRKCPYCDTNVHARYIREHILKEHYSLKPYKCIYCSFESSHIPGMYGHLNAAHIGLPKRYDVVEIPNMLPAEYAMTKGDAKATESLTKTNINTENKSTEPVLKTVSSNNEEIVKKVCLYCEKSVPESEMNSHSHGTEKAEFAKRGDIVLKCGKCLILRLSLTSLQEHFKTFHPSDKIDYDMFRLQMDTREIYCCGHCYKKFKFLRDLKVHHFSSHTQLTLSYTSIPYSHNLHTEGDSDLGKRKSLDAAGPSTKRIAKKSTSKLPNSTVAKKSTTKLPLTTTSEGFSYYGSKPAPLDKYNNLKVILPSSNTVIETDVKKLSGSLKINPKIVIKDFKS